MHKHNTRARTHTHARTHDIYNVSQNKKRELPYYFVTFLRAWAILRNFFKCSETFAGYKNLHESCVVSFIVSSVETITGIYRYCGHGLLKVIDYLHVSVSEKIFCTLFFMILSKSPGTKERHGNVECSQA